MELPALQYGDHLEPPFWGTSNLLNWSAENVFQSIKRELVKSEWAAVNSSSFISPENPADFDTLFSQFEQEVIGSDLIQAFGIYGFFPVITDNKQLIIIDPSDFHTELMSLDFPESDKLKRRRSISDFFRPSGDSIAIQAGTLGTNIQLRYQSYLQNSQTRLKGQFLQVAAEHCTKIITEKLATEIRRCLGLERGIGIVFDLTGPGMPPPDSRTKIFELLSLEERLGIELTDRFAITPLHSAVGIFVHHPEAALNRMEQS